MADKYTVVWGDTLSELAVKFNTTVQNLVNLNDITDPNKIYEGQELIVSGTATTVQSKTNTTSRAVIKGFGLLTNSTRTVYATWTWSKSYTENYQVMWYYDTGDGVWFVGNDSTVKYNQSQYNAPENAKRVKFKVKPISKKRKVNNKETDYWIAAWSTEREYSFSNNPPIKPGVPTVTIKDLKLTATLDNIDANTKQIQFFVVKDNSTTYASSGYVTVKMGTASYSCTVAAGSSYKVRCRAVRDKQYSDYTDFSASVNTQPSTPTKITVCKATSETSVYLEWSKVNNADSYEIEYTTDKKYFDGSDATTTVGNIEFNHYEKTGLTSGDEYFFRVRAINSGGSSGWSEISSTIIGKKPAAPTTWSSTTVAVTGETVNLYWVHNSEDGSSQTYAELEMYIDGDKKIEIIENTANEDDKDKTSVYSISTSGYKEGAKIQWRVRTTGITNTFGDWSIQRTIDVYSPPSLELRITDGAGGGFDILRAFPFYIRGLANPNTQKPIGYHVVITANERYETVDQTGTTKLINAGDAVYSKHFDISQELLVEMSAGNVDLENNVSYTVNVTASMDSGLTCNSSIIFSVAWTDIEYQPNAEIMLDETNYSVSIRPYCEDENAALLDGVLMSVYRREYDGTFTELAKDIDNKSNTFVTDPHPALDYARYRVIAKAKTNGAMSYYDVPGYPIGASCIIIQWDEAWSNFNNWTEDALEQPTWGGSLLKLPYNIDVSDSNKSDVALIEYIGRKRPVSYYGTQLGESATWNTAIPKDDKETLYALRRLAIWPGDVYVREPSGTGYWANVQISFSQRHNELTIPVTLNVTRVEGGV